MTITRLFGYLAEPVRDLTPCVDLWTDPGLARARLCENRDQKRYTFHYVCFFICIYYIFYFQYRRTHVRSDQKHTCQHGADRALPAGTTGRDIFYASRPLLEKHAVQTHNGHNSGR